MSDGCEEGIPDWDGSPLGAEEGSLDLLGVNEGSLVGLVLKDEVERADDPDGCKDGPEVGMEVGFLVGIPVGFLVGIIVGFFVGILVGLLVGALVVVIDDPTTTTSAR